MDQGPFARETEPPAGGDPSRFLLRGVVLLAVITVIVLVALRLRGS